MSRPSSSDPQICSNEGGASRVARFICAGSWGASHGAKIAQITKKVTNTAPIAASGLRRARRGSEMAPPEMLLSLSLDFETKNIHHRGTETQRHRNSILVLSSLCRGVPVVKTRSL